jgi:hypothetical protein
MSREHPYRRRDESPAESKTDWREMRLDHARSLAAGFVALWSVMRLAVCFHRGWNHEGTLAAFILVALGVARLRKLL